MLLKKQMGGKNGVGGGLGLLQNGDSSSGGVIVDGGEANEKLQLRPSSSPTTDLDRIMSSPKFGGVKRQSFDVPAKNNNNSPQDAKDEAKQFNRTDNPAIASSDAKIPISMTPTNLSIARSASTGGQNDDEFDADIDMVDFFNKQSGTDSRLQSHLNAKSLHHHVRKAKGSTDDRMPGDVVSPPGSAFSPEGSRKALSGDSLLSSLDGM